MLKTKVFALFVGILCWTTSSALPQYALSRTYFSDSTYTTVVGEYTAGCTAGSISFKGSHSSYIIQDPVKYDCGNLGYPHFSSSVPGCFTGSSATYVTADNNGDGAPDGYTPLKTCIDARWGWPFI